MHLDIKSIRRALCLLDFSKLSRQGPITVGDQCPLTGDT